MNDEDFTSLEPVGDEPLEARIVAWVLGDASAFEAAELERLCEERPELLVFRRRMQALHGLLSESESAKPDEAWKLPAEKRAKIEALFGDMQDTPAEKTTLPMRAGNRGNTRRERARNAHRPWLRQALMATAACITLATGFHYVFSPVNQLNSVAVFSKKAEKIDISGGTSFELKMPATPQAHGNAPAPQTAQAPRITARAAIPGSARAELAQPDATASVGDLQGTGLSGGLGGSASGGGGGVRSGFGSGFAADGPAGKRAIAENAPALAKQSQPAVASAPAKSLGGRPDLATGAARPMGGFDNSAADIDGFPNDGNPANRLAGGPDTGKKMAPRRADEQFNFSLRDFDEQPSPAPAGKPASAIVNGSRARTASPEIAENTKTKDSVIRREVPAEPGDAAKQKLAGDPMHSADAALAKASGGGIEGDIHIGSSADYIFRGADMSSGAGGSSKRDMGSDGFTDGEEFPGRADASAGVDHKGGSASTLSPSEVTKEDSKPLPAGREAAAQAAAPATGGLAQREIVRRQEAVGESDRLVAEGRDAYAKGDFKQAVDKFNSALEKLPEAPALEDRRKAYEGQLTDGSVALASQYRKVGKYDEARDLLNGVLQPDREPENLDAKRELDRLNDPARTHPALADDGTQNVDKIRRDLYTGEGALALGKYDEAKKQFEDVLSADPYNSAARRGMEKIASAKSDYYRAAYDHTRAELLAEADGSWELSVPADAPPAGEAEDADAGQLQKLRKLVAERSGKDITISPDAQKYLNAKLDYEKAKADLDGSEARLRALQDSGKGDATGRATKASKALQDLATEVRDKGAKADESLKLLNLLEKSGRNPGEIQTLEATRPLNLEEKRLENWSKALGRLQGDQRFDFASGIDLPGNIVQPLYLQYVAQQRALAALKTQGLEDRDPAVLAKTQDLANMRKQLETGVASLSGTIATRLQMKKDMPDAAKELPTGRPVPKIQKPKPAPVPTDETSANDEPFSTFSLHVSDASFKLAKTALDRGERPSPEQIRTEEFYNAFDYGDPSPAPGEPVACHVEQTGHPVLPQRNLVRVAMRVGSSGRGQGQPLNLTVLLDNSGSMEREDRRAGLKAAVSQLASLLKPGDTVTLAGFSRTPHLLADRLSGAEAAKLVEMVDHLPSQGGTNLEEALKLASELAVQRRNPAAQNRIVLLTDGAANLGNAQPEELAEQVSALRQQGIAFDAAGIGAGGTNDRMLEALTRHGNGRYYIVNDASDADANFARQLAGAFRPAAENVKVQVHFNPDRVARYKLIGFEKHRLNTEDFHNDKVDAAELAADEAGVALYQVEVLPEGSGELGEVSVRFRDAATGTMVERSWTIAHDEKTPAFDQAAPSMQLATLSMLAAEKLRGGPLADATDFTILVPELTRIRNYYSTSTRVREFLGMADKLK